MRKHVPTPLSRLFALAALAFALLMNAAAAAEPVASLPYAVDYNGWLTVKVRVNGEGPYDFIIDTGATQSLIFRNLADLHAYEPTGASPQTVLGMSAQGAFPPHYVGDLALGEAALEDLATVILPDWDVEEKPQGIIGLDFLTRYIAIFDASAGRLDLYDPAAPPPDDRTRRWKRTRLKPDNFGLDIDDLYTINGRVNNRRVRFLVDLGASGTVLNRSAVAFLTGNDTRISIRPSGGAATGRITDALEQTEIARSVYVDRIRVGGVYWYRRQLAIHDAAIFEELNVHTKPFGLFGADLIRDRSFKLDFPNGEMRIGPRARS